jgi:membrane protein
VLATLHQFAANAGALTLAGSALLLATAVALLLTVENAFNQIWNVKRGRPLARRVGVYLLLLAVAPPILGLCLWATSTLLGASMGWLAPLPPSALFVLDLGPAALAWVGLAGLFRYLPNTRVRWRDALAGSLVAAAALELGKRAFAAYLLQIPTYRAVYGAFAVFPVFLLWIYYSWLVTLAAALVSAGLGRAGSAARR